MNPDLSVVIVSWNVRALLERCLASLQKPEPSTTPGPSTSLRLEIIVIDNGSTDGSVEMLRAHYPQVTLVSNQENRGFAAANNQGIAAAHGQHVLLLNPDTEIRGDSLARLVAFLEVHPDVGLVAPQLLFPDGSVQSSRRRFPTLTTLFLESTWLAPLAPSALLRRYYMLDQPDDVPTDVDWVMGAAMLVRRMVTEQVGGLDEGFFMYSEELDWCRRIKAAGWRIVYYPDAQVVHHEGKSSEQAVTARHINFQRSKIRYTRKYHSRMAAGLLRTYLLAMYVWQLALEGIKGLAGHKRALRRQRINAYWQVLKSGL